MILKYFDSGLYCLPIAPREKRTALPAGYSTMDFSLYGVDPEILDVWDKKYPPEKEFGIALICGKASGIIALDVDSDDPGLLAIIPYSPCEKRGAKGLTRFFRYQEKWERKVILRPNGKGGVEILTNGNYTILPGSIHPDTGKPYFWIGDGLLEINKNDLPFLEEEAVEKIGRYLNGQKENSETGYVDVYESTGVDLVGEFNAELESGRLRCAHGAHDRLKKVAAQLLAKNTDLDTAAVKLLDYDNEHHLKLGYFSDRSRGKDSKSSNALANAMAFYLRMAESINKQRSRKGEPPHEITLETITTIKEKPLIETTPETKISIAPPMPDPIGRIKDIVHCTGLYSPYDVTPIGYGYALGVMSMLLGNRFTLEYKATLWPANIIVFIVAESGMGKNLPRKYAEGLLYGHNMSSASEYTSPVALLGEFQPIYKTTKKRGEEETTEVVKPSKRELFLSIDEVDGLINSMARGSDGFEKRWPKVMIELFDASKDQFWGQESKTSKLEGMVKNPFVTLVGTTQPVYFREAIRGNFSSKGILQRGIFLELSKIENMNFDKKPDFELETKIKKFVTNWLDTHKVKVNTSGKVVELGKENSYAVNYQLINATPRVEGLLKEIEREKTIKRAEYLKNGDSLSCSLLARHLDNILKLSQSAWIATLPEEMTETPWLHHLDESHVTWAQAFVDWNYEQGLKYFENADRYMTQDNKDMELIIEEIKKKGHLSLTDLALSRAGRKLGAARRTILVNLLKTHGIVKLAEMDTEGRKKTVLILVTK